MYLFLLSSSVNLTSDNGQHNTYLNEVFLVEPEPEISSSSSSSTTSTTSTTSADVEKKRNELLNSYNPEIEKDNQVIDDVPKATSTVDVKDDNKVDFKISAANKDIMMTSSSTEKPTGVKMKPPPSTSKSLKKDENVNEVDVIGRALNILMKLLTMMKQPIKMNMNLQLPKRSKRMMSTK